MSKQINAEELAEMVKKILNNDLDDSALTIDSFAYSKFMTSIAQAVCDTFGGEIHHNADAMDDTWYIGIHGNSDVPSNGGIWKDYDQDGELFDTPTESEKT